MEHSRAGGSSYSGQGRIGEGAWVGIWTEQPGYVANWELPASGLKQPPSHRSEADASTSSGRWSRRLAAGRGRSRGGRVRGDAGLGWELRLAAGRVGGDAGTVCIYFDVVSLYIDGDGI